MQISELRPGLNQIILSGRVVALEEPRTVGTRFGPARVSAAMIEDDTGRVKLNLWRDQIEKVKLGDVIRLENAFCTSFRDQIELSLGKSGSIVVIGPKVSASRSHLVEQV